MATARDQHTATLLPNGKVLVTGGWDGTTNFTSAEIYDPSGGAGLGTWSATDPLATARRSHSSTLLQNGKVLVTQGYNGAYLKSAELYSSAGTNLGATGSLTTTRSGGSAVVLQSGKVLVAGGFNAGPISAAELGARLDLWRPRVPPTRGRCFRVARCSGREGTTEPT